MLPTTTTISSPNEDDDVVSNFWDPFKTWRQEWYHHKDNGGKEDEGNDNSEFSKSKENAIHPIEAARTWIQQNASAWLTENPPAFHQLLVDLLSDSPSEPPTRLGLGPDDNMPKSKQEASLRHLEWSMVLLLELRLHCPSKEFLRAFIQAWRQPPQRQALGSGKATRPSRSRKSSKQSRKRQIMATKSQPQQPDQEEEDEQLLGDYLIRQLTQVAFLLPSTEPLSSFVRQRIWKHSLWKRLPGLMTRLLDTFEIENPIKFSSSSLNPNENDHDDEWRRKTKKQKRPIMQKSSSALQAPPARRRLLIQRPSSQRRTNHFHGMRSDVEKLLDSSPPPPPPSKTACQSSYKRRHGPSKGSTTNNNVQPPLMKRTCLHSSLQQPSPVSHQPPAQSQKSSLMNKLPSVTVHKGMLSPMPTRDRRKFATVAENPQNISRKYTENGHKGMLSPMPTRDRRKFATVAETPNNISRKYTVAETPTMATRGQSTVHAIVAETPKQQGSSSSPGLEHATETFNQTNDKLCGERLVFSPGIAMNLHSDDEDDDDDDDGVDERGSDLENNAPSKVVRGGALFKPLSNHQSSIARPRRQRTKLFAPLQPRAMAATTDPGRGRPLLPQPTLGRGHPHHQTGGGVLVKTRDVSTEPTGSKTSPSTIPATSAALSAARSFLGRNRRSKPTNDD